jgi:hypothetical protein
MEEDSKQPIDDSVDSDCYLGVPFKAGLTMYCTSMSHVLEEILRIGKKYKYNFWLFATVSHWIFNNQ